MNRKPKILAALLFMVMVVMSTILVASVAFADGGEWHRSGPPSDNGQQASFGQQGDGDDCGTGLQWPWQ